MFALAQPQQHFALPRLPLEADLFGRVLQEYWEGKTAEYGIRRDDNIIERDSSARYFRSWEQMPAHQRCLLNHARGRVLDFGAGAGQHTLALQERGLEVVAIDQSPRAVEVCRARGVRDIRRMNGMALAFEDSSFDTVLLLGNNPGIAGDPEGLRQLLTDLHRVMRPGGQLLAELSDYTATHNPSNLRYHQWNLARGRYPGSVSMRIEYDGHCSPLFDWLLPKLSDFRRLCMDTGWKVIRCVQVLTDATFAIGVERI